VQVLTSIDEPRIAELRELGHFFWLDVHAPTARELDRAGELLGLTRWRWRTRSSSASGRRSTSLRAPRAGRLLHALVGTFFVTWTADHRVFGQNFGWLVASVDTRSDFLVLGLGGLLVPTIALGAVLWVKRRDWF
jgi:Mg2+ and Co2+ transporter CorA